MASVEKRIRDGKVTWTVRWRDGDQQKRKTLRTQEQAKLFAASVMTDKARGTYMDPQAGKVRLADYAQQWLAGQTFDEATRQATELRLRVHVVPHLGQTQLSALRASAIQAWLRALQADLAPRYVRVIFANLSAVLSAAVDDDLIPKNPCRAGSIKLPRLEPNQVEPWLADEVLAVARAVPDRFRVMVLLGAGCGLRQGEIFGLAVEDIDFLRGVLHVRRQIKILGSQQIFGLPKGKKLRDVPLPESVALEVAAHLQRHPARQISLPWDTVKGPDRGARLVLSTREGTALNRNYVNAKIWKPGLIAAGVEPTRENGMHALRHFYSSVLLDGGENVRALAEYLGHSDPGFTLRTYCHLMPSSDQRTKKAVDAVLVGTSTAADGLSCAPAVP